MTPFGKKTLETPDSIHEIEKQISMACGKEMKIKYIDKKEQAQEIKNTKDNQLESFANNFDLPININEE